MRVGVCSSCIQIINVTKALRVLKVGRKLQIAANPEISFRVLEFYRSLEIAPNIEMSNQALPLD